MKPDSIMKVPMVAMPWNEILYYYFEGLKNPYAEFSNIKPRKMNPPPLRLRRQKAISDQ